MWQKEDYMEILKHLKVPTGDILVVNGTHGKLEMLSLGDYGQAVNLNQDKSVPDGLPLLPLTEKWVVTVSTQYGCSMNCKFCDVPKVGPGRNATFGDLVNQIKTALFLPGVPNNTARLNVHYARMGEPTWNTEVLESAKWLSYLTQYHPHPVVSTMMPKRNNKLTYFVHTWMDIKNHWYQGNAGLQLSINSTNEGERWEMFKGNACTLEEISTIMQGIKPFGRKITLNFAVADYTVDPNVLLKYFDPQHYIVKLTPMHKTATALESNIITQGNYTTPEPYMLLRDKLKRAGYDVLVFIASRDEDEGRITCGNAILSGSLPSKYEIIKETL
jgi:23S rRNA (adenine2503-C2)-methyltransferase